MKFPTALISSRIIVLAIAMSLFSLPAFAAGYSNVAINGQVLTLSELANLQQQIGTRIAPGYYLVDTNTGCWLNQSSGASGCLGDSTVNYQSNQGSGAYDGNGNWNHYDSNSHWGVGGTADGCIYTPDWSNC
jgi:hypothetical protein